MKKVIHKWREKERHFTKCWKHWADVINVSWFWKDVTCKNCLRLR